MIEQVSCCRPGCCAIDFVEMEVKADAIASDVEQRWRQILLPTGVIPANAEEVRQQSEAHTRAATLLAAVQRIGVAKVASGNVYGDGDGSSLTVYLLGAGFKEGTSHRTVVAAFDVFLHWVASKTPVTSLTFVLVGNEAIYKAEESGRTTRLFVDSADEVEGSQQPQPQLHHRDDAPTNSSDEQSTEVAENCNDAATSVMTSQGPEASATSKPGEPGELCVHTIFCAGLFHDLPREVQARSVVLCRNRSVRQRIRCSTQHVAYVALHLQDALPTADLAVCFHGGLWGYETWAETFEVHSCGLLLRPSRDLLTKQGSLSLLCSLCTRLLDFTQRPSTQRTHRRVPLRRYSSTPPTMPRKPTTIANVCRK